MVDLLAAVLPLLVAWILVRWIGSYLERWVKRARRRRYEAQGLPPPQEDGRRWIDHWRRLIK